MKTKVIMVLAFALTATFANAQDNENIFSMKLGKGKFFLLSERQTSGSTEILLGAHPEIITKYAPNRYFPMATNVFLWQENGKNLLFDTGYGKALAENLQSLQLAPENIDAIFITHMHGDHIGGLLRDDQAAFPNAKLYIAQAEHDYWTNDDTINNMPEKSRASFLLAKKVVEAYKDRLHLFVPDTINHPQGKTIYPGIKAIEAYGHTAGHTGYILVSDKKMLLFIWGDLIHAMAVQMPHPRIAVTYDSDAVEAIHTRLTILQSLLKYEIPVAGMHIPYPGIGNIEKSEPGYKFIPIK